MVLLRDRVARRGPPAGPGWIHEIKHDGFRIMAAREGTRVRLITRAGNDFSWRFPSIAVAVAQLPVQSCVARLGEHALAGTGTCERSRDSTRKATKMAEKTIDHLVDQAAAGEERAQRKRRLIKGPREFRDLRPDKSTAKDQP